MIYKVYEIAFLKKFINYIIYFLNMVNEENIIEILKSCNDPEIGVDIWTLGLIYELNIDNGVYIKMTFTTPHCPYGPMIVDDIKNKVLNKYKIMPNVEVVFDPPWKPSDELRELLGV